MSRLRSRPSVAIAVLGLAVALPPGLVGAESGSPAPGPAIGAVAPDFEAQDQTGRTRDFQSLTGDNGLLLLFFRSADW